MGKKSALLYCCCWTRGWEASGTRKLQVGKWGYFVGFLATTILTWCFRDYASQGFADSVGEVATFCGSAGSPEDQQKCAGAQIAMRISFANFVFFMLLAILTINMTRQDDPRIPLHAGGWGIKFVVWACTIVGFFWVPSKAIYGYAQFARIGSGIFLVLQLILLINFFYEINEKLVEFDTKRAWAALILGALLTMSLGVVALGFAYYWYTASPSCHLNIFFCTWSLIMGLAVFAVLFLPSRAATAGLLTSGLVYLYCAFLLLSALSSEPPDAMQECKRGTGANPRWIQILGFFIALATVLYSTFDAGVSSHDMFGTKYLEDGLSDLLPYRADFFHAMYALASLYIAMLFSNWSVSSSTQEFQLDQGWVSTWVKMGSKWCCELLYLWSVIAPACLPNRDFGP